MSILLTYFFCFFFFNDTATTEIYTLSLHDALPIWCPACPGVCWRSPCAIPASALPSSSSNSSSMPSARRTAARSEEHTSELQSQSNLVCRLLLEKKKKTDIQLE